MKKTFFALIFTFPLALFAGEEQNRKSAPAYVITKTAVDNSLKKNEAVFVFTFRNADLGNVLMSEQEIRMGFNGSDETVKTNKSGQYTYTTKPGKYQVQFFVDPMFFEVYIDSIEIKPRYKTEITVYMHRSDVMIEADKPVIYLYPEKTTEVSVRLDIKGEFLFTYPEYENGWNVTANPDGKLQQGNKTFNYLFWEGKTQLPLSHGMQEGFVLKTEDLTGFFEEKLSQLGLNSTEKQDFITYWVPRMQSHHKHFVQFVLNDVYDTYAKLTVIPQPDCMIRVFMLWDALEHDEEMTVKPQELPTLHRKGFTLVEWGGAAIEQSH